jgi:Uma2 family endonuclease
VSKQPHIEHDFVCDAIAGQVRDWNRTRRLGRIAHAPGVIFTPENAVAPDVIWISHERLAKGMDDAGHLRVAPELVVEVLSPEAANERRDRESKLRTYEQFSVDEYWIVDWRTRQVEVYRRQGAALVALGTVGVEATITPPALPGLSVRVAELFAAQ